VAATLLPITKTFETNGGNCSIPPIPPNGGGGNGLGGLNPSEENQNQNVTNVDEEIATKLPTDTTPVDPNAWTNGSTSVLIPLEGQGVQNSVSITAADVDNSNFNASVVQDLSNAGVVSGSGSGNNFFNLDKGNVLFSPQLDEIFVQTHEGQVNI